MSYVKGDRVLVSRDWIRKGKTLKSESYTGTIEDYDSNTGCFEIQADLDQGIYTEYDQCVIDKANNCDINTTIKKT